MKTTVVRFVITIGLLAGCDPYVERPPAPEHDGVYGFADGCYLVDATEPGSTNTRWLAKFDNGKRFAFRATDEEAAAHFTMRAADLGTYLFYDAERHFLVAEDDRLARVATLDDEVMLLDDSFRSPAEWDVEVSAHDAERFQLRHHATGKYLTTGGLTDDVARAAVVAFYPSTGCAAYPEMSLDAEGVVQPRQWPDGDVYGIVEQHAHLMTNFGFGGGGIFHGAPFHRLGVEHALPSCERFHGEEGRRDLVGFAFSGLGELEPTALLSVFVAAMTPEFNHHTDGWPTFTDWPNSWKSSTHQTQYYRWLERAYRGGLRLMVQHATTNSVLCELIVGLGAQQVRYSCNDMVAVERIIAETRNLERYIDAQSGGPGKGWFRVVTSPAEARAVINEGKLAVLLGIETSNLFDCLLTPGAGEAPCDAATVRAELDRFHALGVRALFPVHKFDNAFGPGDGDRNVGQIGSFINSGHYSNMVTDCPSSPTVFDRGPVTFGGLNRPRESFLEAAPNDMSMFGADPIQTVAPFLGELQAPALEGEYCQKATLTPLGETLIHEMMLRGMIVEVDHLPRRSYLRAYELLGQYDYPAAATHGNSNNGRIYELGGVSSLGLGRCGDPARRGAMGDSLRRRVAEVVAHGGYPAQGLSFDLNGFAGGPRPRFGEDSGCGEVPQANPITYPFTSHAGDVTFTAPRLGDRAVDFNTEGMIHLGLLPEYIEDARRDGVTDAELEPLFRSAEGYLRMWERAEARGAELRAQASAR
jgi:microsomal dipeptidase-like Zn-dependent dipeptidase